TMLKCGACDDDQTCGGVNPNKCGVGRCVPKTVCDPNQCGDLPDGCGGKLHCGGCTAPQTCGGGGIAHMCGCAPATCDQLLPKCGPLPDGCGGMLDCATCNGKKVCVESRCVKP